MTEKRRWQKVSSKLVYDNQPFFNLVEDTVVRPDGKESRYPVVETHGAVFVVARTTDDRYIFVEQHRYPVDLDTIELPAGTLPAGADPLEIARQELHEELGVVVDQVELLGQIYANPSRTRARALFIALATGIDPEHFSMDNQEANEAINDILCLTEAEVVAKIAACEIADAVTVAGLNLYWSKYGYPQG